MTADVRARLPLLLCALACAILAALRSRHAPRLRPAAVALAAFAALDAVRLMVAVLGSAAPWWFAWLDVAAFCVLPACAMGLLAARRLEDADPQARESRWATVRDVDAVSDACAGGGRSGARAAGGSVPFGRSHPRILPRLAPAAVCVAYAVAMLALRHAPIVRAHWIEALQAPRVVAFGWALAVALKQMGPGVAVRPRAPTREPIPGYGSPLPGGVANVWAEGPTSSPTVAPVASAARTLREDYRPGRDPSTAIGVVLALGGGVCVAAGLWAAWDGVRTVALVSWGIVALVAWRAR